MSRYNAQSVVLSAGALAFFAALGPHGNGDAIVLVAVALLVAIMLVGPWNGPSSRVGRS